MTTQRHDGAEQSSNSIERSDPYSFRIILGLVSVLTVGGIKSCIDHDDAKKNRATLEWQLDACRSSLREKSDQILGYQRAENIRLLKNQILTAWDMARVSMGFLVDQNARDAQNACHIGVLTMDTVPNLNPAPINFIPSHNPSSLTHNTRANLHGAIISLQHVMRQATDLANPSFDSCPTNRCPTQAEKKWAEDVANLANAYLRQLLPIYSRACRSGGCASIDLPTNIPPREELPENEWLFQNQ